MPDALDPLPEGSGSAAPQHLRIHYHDVFGFGWWHAFRSEWPSISITILLLVYGTYLTGPELGILCKKSKVRGKMHLLLGQVRSWGYSLTKDPSYK